MALPVADSFTDQQGNRWEYRTGEHKHQIIMLWHGRKTRRSARETWNPVLIISGPVSWKKVTTEWAARKKELPSD